MKKLLVALFFLTAAFSFAQQKYALVIGNGAYANITKLNNPVNDANDMEAALKGLGFTVDKVLNGTLEQMESAAIRLKNRLSSSKNSYGFLFYAGHGVQSNGENYLIPVDANIQSESFLRQRAVSVQSMLDELNQAGNSLNVVVLDACRDNPFSWSRSGIRGLQIVGNQPAGSIIVFATAAGSVASDGNGRNGLFTGHLLNNLKTPGLEITEVFRRTMRDVLSTSNNQQHPAVYNQFAGLAYLGSQPTAAVVQPTPAPRPAPAQTYKIGDLGPAGGIIFYDKGKYTDGWRYMEAAPVDLVLEKRDQHVLYESYQLMPTKWGQRGKNVKGTKTGIGFGKRNTELIIAALNQEGESGKAAQLCKAYTLNGYNDWFLPSKYELDLMYTNLKKNKKGGFEPWLYWSSSQYLNNTAWAQRFYDGSKVIDDKDNTMCVRAVRAF
jgi:hypothetical protein